MSLPLEGINNIHGGDSLPLGMFSVGYSIPDSILQEHLENTSCLLIDKSGDPLDTSPPGQPPNGRLGDPLDVVPQHLSMPLGTSLAQSLASFPTSSHCKGRQATDGDTGRQLLYVVNLNQSQLSPNPLSNKATYLSFEQWRDFDNRNISINVM